MKEGRPEPSYEALRKQDPQEWESFITNYHDLFVGVAHRAGLTDFNAEDAVQESVLNFYLRREMIDPNSSPIAYILASIRHKAIDAQRHAGKHYTEPIEDRDFHDPFPFETPDDVIARLDFQRALEPLPLEQQAVLFDLSEGWTYDQIAQRQGISPGTTKTRIRLGRAKVQKNLGEAA